MKFLFTTFEGGGHVPPAVLMARLLQARGHEVLLVSDEANRELATHAGLRFASWETAPNRQKLGQPDDPLQDWRRFWPPAVVKAVCEAVITGPSGQYAADTIRLINEFHPDLVVSNELLLGVVAACEARQLPCALLTANLWSYPGRRSLPPFGPGWPEAKTAFQRHRQEAGHDMVGRWYDAGLKPLNQARHDLKLAPLSRTLDQLTSVATSILGTSRAFDLPHRPDDLVYAGPLFEALRPEQPSALIDPTRPNILLSFSTTYQDQSGLFARCLKALEPLDAKVIVTTGPAVHPNRLPITRNAQIIDYAPHDEIVPWCDLVVCHGGHGTLLRPIRHGVPVLCLTMGRDHPDNGVRLEAHGAGIRLNHRVSAHRIRRAAQKIMSEPQWRLDAQILGQKINASLSSERSQAIDILEKTAQRSRMT